EVGPRQHGWKVMVPSGAAQGEARELSVVFFQKSPPPQRLPRIIVLRWKHRQNREGVSHRARRQPMPGPPQVIPVQQSEIKSTPTGSASNRAGDTLRVQAKIAPQTRYPPGVLKHRLSHGSQTGARRSARRDDNPGWFPLAEEKPV